jgi:L-threonylcarbamoyladenylate synthase
MTTEVRPVTQTPPDPAAIAAAADVLRRGGLVAFPTETVYGLGANALRAEAVRRVFTAKGRPSTDPLIVHITGIEVLPRVAASIPAVVRVLAAAFWPGPLTVIVPRHPDVPVDVTAGLDTVAVRVPAHPVARALLQAADIPVAAPSANRFSRPSPTTAEHVRDELGGRIPLILDGGATPVGVESTIVDCTVTPPVVRRAGGVTLEQLREVVPDIVVRDEHRDAGEAQVAPGQLLRHYAPSAPLTLYVGPADAVRVRLATDARRLAARGLRVGLLVPAEDALALAPDVAALAAQGRVLMRACGRRAVPATMAAALFATLRDLDADAPDVVLASDAGTAGLGAAVRDRLTRAAEGRVVRLGAKNGADE